jgi:hypothetical protein
MSFRSVSALLLLAALLGFLSPAGPAAANPLDAIDEDDQEALEALVLYPEDVREQALRVASEPARLKDLQELQEESQDDFRDLLGPYSQDDQEDLFELSRYPDLVEDIARGGPKSRGELERLAADYPEEVRAAAVRQGGERHSVVSRMHALLADFDGRFGDLIEDLPQAQQEAFRAMLRTPELLSLMVEHTDMTVLLGDAYERNPGELRDALADLNLAVAKRNAEDADDWKRSVESDPDLRRDYESAARDYQGQTGYSAYQPRTVVNVSINPYPFWVGYPWWYPVTYDYYDPWYWWYPRRHWGHCGYYYGPRVAFYGGPIWRPWYPSYAFTSWYFSFGHHHHRYPYLSDHFVSYYQQPVVIQNNFYVHNVQRRVVKKFVYKTDGVVPANYWRGKGKKERIESFREYGKIAPAVEKAEKDARRQELAGKRGSKRPGRDFAIDTDGKAAEVGRAEARKLVSRNPKDFPELSKVSKEDWERPRGKGRGKQAAGDLGTVPDTSRGKGKEKGSAAVPSLDDDAGDKGKGRARGKTQDAQPSLEGDSSGKGRARSGGGSQGGDPSPKSGKGRGRSDTGKATPTFESPTQDQGDGGGKSKSKAVDRSGRGKSSDVDRSGDGGRAKSMDADRSGDGGGSKGSSRARNPEPRQTYDPPKQKAPKYEAPKYEAPRAEPRVERSGGGRDRGDGGGGGGGNNKKKNAEEEQQEGGGGHGKRGR